MFPCARCARTLKRAHAHTLTYMFGHTRLTDAHTEERARACKGVGRARVCACARLCTGCTYISVGAIDYFTHVELSPIPAGRPTRRRDASYRARYRRYIAQLSPSARRFHPSSSAGTPTSVIGETTPRAVKPERQLGPRCSETEPASAQGTGGHAIFRDECVVRCKCNHDSGICELNSQVTDLQSRDS